MTYFFYLYSVSNHHDLHSFPTRRSSDLSLRMVGNHSQSAKAEGSLTARLTSRAGTKVGLSDPVVPHGRAIAQRIKATLGITGLSPPRVHIDGEVWHLDVDELLGEKIGRA